MLWKTASDLPEEVKAKLSQNQQEVFFSAFSQGTKEGRTEEECFRIAWTAAVKLNGRIVHDAFLFKPGDWDAATGDGKISEVDCEDGVFVINRRDQIGAPIGLKYDHSEDIRSIPVGITVNAKLKSDHVVRGDVYLFQDAQADLDGSGMKILATIDQMADALLTDSMKMSVEAFRNVKCKSYYGDRMVHMEPTAMAILPTGVAPAVVEKLVAQRGEQIVFSVSNGTTVDEGNGQMELEELIKAVEALAERLLKLEEVVLKDEKPKEEEVVDPEADVAASADAKGLHTTITEMKETIKTQAEKLDEYEKTELEKEVKDLEDSLKAKVNAGTAERIDESLGKAENLSEKKAILSRFNEVFVADSDEDEEGLKTGRRNSSGDPKKSLSAFERKVTARMEKTGEGRFAASTYVIDNDMDESEIEMKEV